MPENLTPRQLIRKLVQGIAPPRPLFLPIVFAHAARIENLPLRAFLTNPTKISNSLRQIRAHLRSDGITCYFDPLLEAEAIGGTVEWDNTGETASLRWPQQAAKGELPSGLRSPEDAAKSGRVGVALEVVRRLKPLVRDDCLLTVGLTGPFTLAAQLTQLQGKDVHRAQDIPPEALDFAATAITRVATALVEAGANVLLLREDILPALTVEEAQDWASRLATTTNIVRFYEALPVLLLTSPQSVAANAEVIAGRAWDCVVCPAVDGTAADGLRKFAALGPTRFGIALPPQAPGPGESADSDLAESLRTVVADARPAIVTTVGDLPATADMERLKRAWETLR